MKYILLVVIAFAISTVVLIFGWFGGDKAPELVASIANSEIASQLNSGNSSMERVRYAAMQTEYAKLVKARRNLDRKLARLKALMWGVELPAQQANEVVRKIRKGYELLKLKKLFGAFSNVQDISHEFARVVYVDQSLEEVIEEIKVTK